jgi:GTP cyclohydrolase I
MHVLSRRKRVLITVFGLLKREDEKYLTEHAYENPKFMEDMVRDVALCLQEDDRLDGFIVETENFESIHNHSAYAMIDQMTQT